MFNDLELKFNWVLNENYRLFFLYLETLMIYFFKCPFLSKYQVDKILMYKVAENKHITVQPNTNTFFGSVRI